MNKYRFSTHTSVPEETVQEIISDFSRALTTDLVSLLTKQQYADVSAKINETISKFCNDCRPLVPVENYNLNIIQVLEIAEHLRTYKKIDAIKAFRNHTGAGLVDGKRFIDRFCTDHTRDCRNQPGKFSAANFIKAFINN